MSTGKIKFYNSKRAFGFIIRDDGEPDVFFHRTGIIDPEYTNTIKMNDRVIFETEETDKGIKAIDVEKGADE